MPTEDFEIGRALRKRANAVGLLVSQDPVTGGLLFPHSEVFPSLLVALEQIKVLHARVAELESQSLSLKPWDVIG